MAAISRASPDRSQELLDGLSQIRSRIQTTSSANDRSPTLVAVSKLKPASDILACFEHGQVDFGENYVQELVEKASHLPAEIRWHFIGTLQSNKAKTLAAIPNLHTIQTLTSAKAANALNTHLPSDRETPLNILIQVNTSGEQSKSGLPPPAADTEEELDTPSQAGELGDLALHIVQACPRLRLLGLMTIGSLTESSNEGAENADFTRLRNARDVLHTLLQQETTQESSWGKGGKLLLSMGMSGDFEAALQAGSDIVRVGTGIFGERKK